MLDADYTVLGGGQDRREKIISIPKTRREDKSFAVRGKSSRRAVLAIIHVTETWSIESERRLWD